MFAMDLLSKEMHAAVYIVSNNNSFRIMRGAAHVACFHPVMSIVVRRESYRPSIFCVVDWMSLLLHNVSLTVMYISYVSSKPHIDFHFVYTYHFAKLRNPI